MKRKLILLAVLSTLILGATAYSISLDRHIAREEVLHAETANHTNRAETPHTDDEVKPDEAVTEPTESVEPVADPNGCEAQGKWWRADNYECIDKPAPVIQEPAPVSEPIANVTPAPAATTVAASGSGDCSLVYGYPWPTDTAYRVCIQESSNDPTKSNWADDHTSWAGCMGSFGLMQINCSHGQLYDGAANMAVAFQMWSAAGGTFWNDWPNTCAKVGC